MDVIDYYVADVMTGDIYQGMTLPFSKVSLGHKFSGGSFSATLSTQKMLDQLNQEKWDYFTSLWPKIEEGTATVVPVMGRTVLGEWALWSSSIDDVSGVYTIGGKELHGYPAERVLERDYQYTDRDMGLIAYDLIVDCLKTRQPFQCNIDVNKFAVGYGVSMDIRKKTATYADTLDKLALLGPGFEWFVNSQVVWNGSRPQKVVRDLVFARGRFENPQAVELNGPTPGSPGGSLLAWKRTRNYSKAKASVFVFGKGQGDKQKTADAYTPALVDGRHLLTTAAITASNIDQQGWLDATANAAAADASAADMTVSARIDLDGTPSYPSLGDVFKVRLHPRPTLPVGHEGTYRIGETTFKPEGDLAFMDVEMERIA